jgi:RES domain-containing protein
MGRHVTTDADRGPLATLRPTDLASLARPLRATAWSCRGDELPSSTAIDLISDKPNRWNAEGEPTIYLSGDPALALVESGRHPDDMEAHARLVEVDLALARMLDLRDDDVRRALDLPDDPGWILDRDRTRSVARAIRISGAADGMLVPSAGALDQPDRWNAVVFADDGAGVTASLASPRPAGEIRITRRPVAG